MNEFVACLSCVLYEVGVAFRMECHIIFDVQAMHSMNSHRSVVGVMDCVATDVALPRETNHMEVNGISTQFECLSHTSEFCVLYSTDRGLITR